jgi:hypothetical protein
MGVSEDVLGTPFRPSERPTWMSGWKMVQGSMTPSRLLREPVLHDTRGIRSLV